MTDFRVERASDEHTVHAEKISRLIKESAKERETGVARRPPAYISEKMEEGKAIVALTEEDEELAGFSYIESWSGKEYVANSGLIVAPEYRGQGLGRRIKEAIFDLSREMFPDARIFGITTSPAVMKINSDLGFRPVVFEDLTRDDEFWSGCQSCPNYEILQQNDRKNCLCTAMLYDPEKEEKEETE